MSVSPTPIQKQVCWSALTALGALALGGAICFLIYLIVSAIEFLQPVLLPLAIAGILAYLLAPFVTYLAGKGVSRTLGTLIVFLIFLLVTAGILLSVIPTAVRQGTVFLQNFPTYSKKTQDLGMQTLQNIDTFVQSHTGIQTKEGEEPDLLTKYTENALTDAMTWLQERVPDVVLVVGNLVKRSLGGFLGAFGLIIGCVLIPVFLFYFLRDAPSIVENWASFLPMRASPLKTEIVSLLLEINDYIIAFFRGQILVGVIDGTLIAIALLFMGMQFALLIGLMVAILGIIPYAGTLLTLGPALLIAIAQYGDWTHPLIVLAIFIGVNQLEGLFISPWIVGESVGLHSLTVMVAVLAWTVILGGLLGALLAVPLTAALKVVARRYLWEVPLATPVIPIEASDPPKKSP